MFTRSEYLRVNLCAFSENKGICPMTENRKSILIIGAGAAGLMAACAAADAGAQVTVLDRNEKAGKKIYITGKGRCNYTNACETQDFFRNVLRNPKFLYSAVYSWDADSMTQFLENNGCSTKVERGQRRFPASDHAYDVTDALLRHLRGAGGHIRLRCGVQSILTEEHPELGCRAIGVKTQDGKKLFADAVIVATGGASYPSTGSTGDGYRFARVLGLKVSDPQPSLVPLETAEDWPGQLQGLSLKNVAVRVDEITEVKKKRKPVYEGFGEMLFTHFGVSGPLILSASCHTDFVEHPDGYLLHLDLKPALTQEELIARLRREFEAAPEKQLRSALRSLLPQRLSETVSDLFCQQAGWESDAPVRSMNEKCVKSLAHLFKDVTMHLTCTRGFAEAIVTRGGVSVKEINPSTMETRRIRGLYWAGEVLDVDAYTGGFNLQIAWSTGHLAGFSAAAQD